MRDDLLPSYKPEVDLKAAWDEIKQMHLMNFKRRSSVIKYHEPGLPANQRSVFPYASQTGEEASLAKFLAEKSGSSDESIMHSESINTLDKSFVMVKVYLV